MTLFLSESDVGPLLEMSEVIASVEEAFRREGEKQAWNSMRTRSRAPGSVLNVMHSTLPYLKRAGVKAYVSSPQGTRFVFILFDTSTSAPLAVMGADLLGRYRTGAASGVATKYLYRERSGTLAVLGSGRQALTQVIAISAVISVDEVTVWSPDAARRRAFAARLADMGFKASARGSLNSALENSNVASAITSSAEPFLTSELVRPISHLNICGANVPGHAEATPDAVGSFETVVVDDLTQAKVEYGDLIQAAAAGTFSWDSALDLGGVVSGKSRPAGRTLFKSGGVALEDVAVASMLYDRAQSSGERYLSFELT